MHAIEKVLNINEARKVLRESGSVALMNAGLNKPSDLSEILFDIFEKDCLIPYTDRVSPRTTLHENVYTSTEYSANASIFFHSENCSKSSWPQYIAFYCKTKPPESGNTTVSSVREVTKSVPSEIRSKFIQKNILHIRNLGGMVGNSIKDNFGIDDRISVDKICADSLIEPEWVGEDQLKLKYLRKPITIHPQTKEELWFNNIVYWDIVSLDKPLQRALKRRPEEHLPFKTYFQDGSPIPQEWMTLMADLYRNAQIPFEWEEDCLLILDNMLFTHGRETYSGEREVWTAMGEEVFIN